MKNIRTTAIGLDYEPETPVFLCGFMYCLESSAALLNNGFREITDNSFSDGVFKILIVLMFGVFIPCIHFSLSLPPSSWVLVSWSPASLPSVECNPLSLFFWGAYVVAFWIISICLETHCSGKEGEPLWKLGGGSFVVNCRRAPFDGFLTPTFA